MGKQLKSFNVLLVILKAIFPSHKIILLWLSLCLSLISCYATGAYSKVFNSTSFYLEGGIDCIIPKDVRQTSNINTTTVLIPMVSVVYPHDNDNVISQLVSLSYRWEAQ